MKINTTFQKFKTATGYDGNPEKRGSEISKVDQIFRAYELGINSGAIPAKMALTSALFVACKDWLKTKETKSAYIERFLRPTKMNTNLINRRTAIQGVAEECLIAMQTMDPSLFARAAFDRHKVQSLARGNRPQAAKGLSAGYHLERESWLKSDRKVAIAGSGLHGEVHQLGKKGKKFSELTYKEYEQLDKLAKGGAVQYLPKGDRLDKMLIAVDGKLTSALSGLPASFGSKPFPAALTIPDKWFGFSGFQNELWMYAMDSYGNLFSSAEAKKDVLGPLNLNFFNHSSFNAGREVTSAGLLYVEDGYLRWIDNNSGHYKPSAENVYNCLRLLSMDGVNLSLAVVGIGVYDLQGNMAGIDCYTALHFMNDYRGQPDLFRL